MLDIRSPMRTTHRFAMMFAVLAGIALAHAQAQTPAPASASAPAAKAAVHAGKPQGSATRAPLDLHAPPLNHTYASTELRYIMAADDSSDDSTVEVNVKSAKYVERVPGAPGNQLQAIPWAILHPTQIWRIFAPVETAP